MNNIDSMVKNKEGKALKALAEEGDHDAALAFINLVFEGKYAGDMTETKVKKQARDTARDDAFRFLAEGVEGQRFPAMVVWADANMYGVSEPGQFGSKLMTAHYSVAEECFQNLLDHPDCPADTRGRFLVSQAQAVRFQARIKGMDRRDEALALLAKALEAKDHQTLAHYVLSGIHWDEGDFEAAVVHAKAAYEDYPYAALTLQVAYEKGQGVEQNAETSTWYYDYWKKAGEKPKSKAA